MSNQTDRPVLRTRRWFVAAVVAGVGSTVVGATDLLAAPRRRLERVRHFDVVHDPSVAVTMTNGHGFTVCVKDVASGEVLERHERVTAWNLLHLESAHVQIVQRDDH